MLQADSISTITRDGIQVLKIENTLATAELSLFGGHLLSFIPKSDGRERLWVSDHAIYDGNKPIRGGVPICWPWFGEHDTNSAAPAHGYVRQQNWKLINSEDTASGTSITLQPFTSSGVGFDANAQVTLVVNIGAELNIKLNTTNLSDDEPLTYHCALHSYFTIHDIKQCELFGLTGMYKDKTRDYEYFETPIPYRFTKETDRVHLDTPRLMSIKDKQLNTEVVSTGHDSIVVWNPWQDKSISMGDMADDGYLTMLCVETAITKGKTVLPNETHTLEQIVR